MEFNLERNGVMESGTFRGAGLVYSAFGYKHARNFGNSLFVRFLEEISSQRHVSRIS